MFGDVDNEMTIAQEEIFGPVLSVIPYDDVDDAVRIANDSPYGLSRLGLGRRRRRRPPTIARQVRTGTISVNHFGMAFGAPFGGYKNSGLGRELGPEGARGLPGEEVHQPRSRRRLTYRSAMSWRMP